MSTHVAISKRGRKMQMAIERRLVYTGQLAQTSTGLRKKDIIAVKSKKTGLVKYKSRAKYLAGKKLYKKLGLARFKADNFTKKKAPSRLSSWGAKLLGIRK